MRVMKKMNTKMIRLDFYSQDWYSRGRTNLIVLLWWFVQGTLFRFSLHQMYGWRRLLLRLFGAKVGRHVRILPTAIFTFPWKVSIDDYSWIGAGVEFYSLDTITIGKYCVISQNSCLCTGSHNLTDIQLGLVTKPIEIKDGAWIANDVFVYPGVTLGEMADVAERSTVTNDVSADENSCGYASNPQDAPIFQSTVLGKEQES